MNKKGSFITTMLGAGLAAGASLWLHRRNQTAKQGGDLPFPPMGLEQELTKRMADMIYYDRFQLVVQPVVDLETGGIVGGEVLSRLNHPEQGIIFPDKFLPSIEEAGLFSKFDHYIFNKACDLMRRLSEQGVVLQFLSCNFSRMTLSEKGAATRLSKIADNHGIPHDRMAAWRWRSPSRSQKPIPSSSV